MGKFYREFRPQGPAEKLQVRMIAEYRWRLRRVDLLENSLFINTVAVAERRQAEGNANPHDEQLRLLGEGFIARRNSFLTLTRYRSSIERPLFKALHALAAAQQQRRGQVADGSEILDVTPRTANGGEEHEE